MGQVAAGWAGTDSPAVDEQPVAVVRRHVYDEAVRCFAQLKVFPEMIHPVLRGRLAGAGNPAGFPVVVEDAGGDGRLKAAIDRWQYRQGEEEELFFHLKISVGTNYWTFSFQGPDFPSF